MEDDVHFWMSFQGGQLLSLLIHTLLPYSQATSSFRPSLHSCREAYLSAYCDMIILSRTIAEEGGAFSSK